jgi:hypothetical protein
VTRPRSRRSARSAGARFERIIADYLHDHIDDRIDRRVKTGSKDRGDIGGVRLSPALRSGRVVIECKDCATVMLGPWQKEAEIERGNDDAVVGLVVSKRVGHAHPGLQWVHMTVDDLIGLLTGERPEIVE